MVKRRPNPSFHGDYDASKIPFAFILNKPEHRNGSTPFPAEQMTAGVIYCSGKDGH